VPNAARQAKKPEELTAFLESRAPCLHVAAMDGLRFDLVKQNLCHGGLDFFHPV
jgi:hypothetical protein